MKDKLQTMSFAQKSVVLTFLRTLVAWNELLERATRNTTGRAGVELVEKKVLGVAPGADDGRKLFHLMPPKTRRHVECGL